MSSQSITSDAAYQDHATSGTLRTESQAKGPLEEGAKRLGIWHRTFWNKDFKRRGSDQKVTSALKTSSRTYDVSEYDLGVIDEGGAQKWQGLLIFANMTRKSRSSEPGLYNTGLLITANQSADGSWQEFHVEPVGSEQFTAALSNLPSRQLHAQAVRALTDEGNKTSVDPADKAMYAHFFTYAPEIVAGLQVPEQYRDIVVTKTETEPRLYLVHPPVRGHRRTVTFSASAQRQPPTTSYRVGAEYETRVETSQRYQDPPKLRSVGSHMY